MDKYKRYRARQNKKGLAQKTVWIPKRDVKALEAFAKQKTNTFLQENATNVDNDE